VPIGCKSTILAHYTCLCGLFRLVTTASTSVRSRAFSLIWDLSCIPQTRAGESAGESVKESRCQIYSTDITNLRRMS
jgi:hypothetical protein